MSTCELFGGSTDRPLIAEVGERFLATSEEFHMAMDTEFRPPAPRWGGGHAVEGSSSRGGSRLMVHRSAIS